MYLCNITTKAIIESLSLDGRFKSICKRIAKKPHLSDELYQEFFLTLCEIKDNRLIEAKDGNYLEVLCVGIINNIWGKRYRVKMRESSCTNNLYELSGKSVQIIPDLYFEAEHWFDVKKMVKHFIPEEVIKEEEVEDRDYEEQGKIAREIIQRSMESEDQTERFNSRVFYYSRFKYKSPVQFHRESGIPRMVCYRAYNNYRDQLRQQLCI